MEFFPPSLAQIQGELHTSDAPQRRRDGCDWSVGGEENWIYRASYYSLFCCCGLAADLYYTPLQVCSFFKCFIIFLPSSFFLFWLPPWEKFLRCCFVLLGRWWRGPFGVEKCQFELKNCLKVRICFYWRRDIFKGRKWNTDVKIHSFHQHKKVRCVRNNK